MRNIQTRHDYSMMPPGFIYGWIPISYVSFEKKIFGVDSMNNIKRSLFKHVSMSPESNSKNASGMEQ